MSQDVKPEVIKRTQDILEKYFKKPPLTEKLLKKPPFRFIQDIVSAIINETGFLEGLFTEEELGIDISKDKEAKLAFLTKLIDVVKLITGINLTVRPTKIISGLEPTKTNELLQAIGKALDKKIDSKEAIIHYKNQNQKNSDARKVVSKEQSSKKSITSSSGRSTKVVKKDSRVTEHEKRKSKTKSQEKEQKGRIEEEKPPKKAESKPDNSSEANKEKLIQSADDNSTEKAIDNVVTADITVDLGPKEILDSTDSSVNALNKPLKSRPKSSIPKVDNSVNRTEKNSKESVKQDDFKQQIDSKNFIESEKHKNEVNDTWSNSIPREGTVSAKSRTSNWLDVENNDVEVANIIIDRSEKEDKTEDDMVIIDANKGSLFESTGQQNNVTEEHGYLVAQILKTEQELISTNNTDVLNRKVEIVWQTGVVRDRESALKTIENLRSCIQTLIKFSNPLGKLLDYLQGDVEIMQKELKDYVNQYTDINNLLEEEHMQTNKYTHNMKESLANIESSVYNELNKIHQIKVNITKNEHQIQLLLNDST